MPAQEGGGQHGHELAAGDAAHDFDAGGTLCQRQEYGSAGGIAADDQFESAGGDEHPLTT